MSGITFLSLSYFMFLRQNKYLYFYWRIQKLTIAAINACTHNSTDPNILTHNPHL